MPTLSLLTPPDDAEARMRRALRIEGSGAGGAAPEHGHRARPARHYAQDGDVPVVKIPGRKDHSAAAAALTKAGEALQEERSAREKVELALRQAQALIQTLQTKIAHAEIAHAEELASQRQLTEAALAARKDDEPDPAPAPIRVVKVKAAAPRPVAAEAPADDEPAPVEWWVSGWRERIRR